MRSIQSIYFCFAMTSFAIAADTVNLRLTVRSEDGQFLPCRIHLFDSNNEPIQPSNYPFFRDHFACKGQADVPLPAGSYRYLVARGPEYRHASGMIALTPDMPVANLDITLQRISEVRRLGWYSADLHIHRPVAEIEQLMMAEDLDFGPVITWWNRRNLWSNQVIPNSRIRRFDGHRLVHVMAGEDEREGGALLYFGLQRPIDITKADREFPSPLEFVKQAEAADQHVWIDIEKPFWWDVPVWLASGKADSIGLANNHMWRTGMLPTEAWGRARDKQRLPDPLGNGHWTHEIYYHILNCGFRLPPSAGSASGVLPNPVGYNRVYVHLEGELTHNAWWDGLRSGRCFVTNGPMLICKANGQLPGSVFAASEPVSVKFQFDVSSGEAIKNLQLIYNGDVVQQIEYRPGEETETEFTFGESGWFLVRAMVDNPDTFRFASTGPFYLEVGDEKKTIRRESVQFFQDWVAQRINRVESALEQGTRREEVLSYHFQARQFWSALGRKATDQ